MYIHHQSHDTNIEHLIGGLEHFLFFHILEIIILSDFHIYQRSWTTNQLILNTAIACSQKNVEILTSTMVFGIIFPHSY